MAYFRYFPIIGYDVRGVENEEQYDYVTNLLARVLVKCHSWSDVDGSLHDVLVGVCEFEKHIIIDGETPEILADRFYSDSELHWIILYGNGATYQNPYYDWPMTNFDLKKFVDKKYGVANINATHHYENADGYQVDSTAPTASAITNFKHEETVNDAKRIIKIIQPRYIDFVVDEFKRLMATQ